MGRWKFMGFQGGIWDFEFGAQILNHQRSKISIISVWAQISLWVIYKLVGFQGGIWDFEFGVPTFESPNIWN